MKELIDLYSTLDGKLIKTDQICPGTWVHLTDPSIEELEHRLRGRNTEDEAAIQNRLHEAYRELECSKDYDYKIVNDNLEQAVGELERIICN